MTWNNLLYNFYFRQNGYRPSVISSFYPFSFTHIFFFPCLFHFCCIWTEPCTFFFDDISGWNFLCSFRHFWVELFSQVGGGGCTCTQCTPCVRALEPAKTKWWDLQKKSWDFKKTPFFGYWPCLNPSLAVKGVIFLFIYLLMVGINF